MKAKIIINLSLLLGMQLSLNYCRKNEVAQEIATPEKVENISSAVSAVKAAEEVKQAQESKAPDKTESEKTAAASFHEGKVQVTGKTPEAWEGRSAAAEEKRLREANEWEAKKLQFFEQWASVDPKAALAASRATDRSSITVCTTAAVRGWAGENLQAAKAWVDAQPENAERRMYVTSLYEIIKTDEKSTPEQVGAWLSGQLNVPAISNILGDFITDWSKKDRATSLVWLTDNVKDAALRRKVVSQLVTSASTTSNEEFQKSGEWINQQPKGILRDELLEAYVKEAALADKATSKQWAELIEDKDLKQQALQYCEPAANE